ncbi:MAG: ABC transporter permease [Opitutaceae bacterium]|jgi:lipopolysaccharide transport system permease protein
MLLYQQESWWSLLSPLNLVRKLYRQRSLLRQFTWRNIEIQHKGSTLGLLWSVLSPLLLFAVYAFVFVVIFKGRFGVVPTETRVDYAIGLFLGLALLQLFQEALTVSPLSVVQNPNYVKKVVFPVEILPVAAFGAALFRCLVSLGLVMVACVFWGPGLSPAAWWLPFIVFMLGLLSLGMGWILAAVGVFVRDLVPLMQFFSILLMFTSAVFYSGDQIPHAFAFLRLSPVLIVIETGRAALLWHIQPATGTLVYLGIVSVATCILGHAFFCAAKPAFADVV